MSVREAYLEDRVSVNCAACGGDCVEVCEFSGLRVSGGLITDRESIQELRRRRPLLQLQRRQREQLLEIIDEAEKIGAWLYTDNRRRRRGAVALPGLSECDDAVSQAMEILRAERGKWHSPKQLRESLTGKYSHLNVEMYQFTWHLRYPNEFIDDIQRLWRVVSELIASMNDKTEKVQL